MTVFGVTIARLSAVSEQKSTWLAFEFRRDQEEGGELDSHEKASPKEIKRREVSWTITRKLAQKRSRAGRWCWARERERVGFLLLQLFPNGGLRDSVLHSSWDSNCVVLWSQRNAGRTLL